MEGVRIETAKTAQIVSMLCEGVGVRAAARLSGVDKNTVLRVLAGAGEHCAKLLNEKVRCLTVEQVEVDELYSFVRTRPDNTADQDQVHGEFYLYLSVDRHTKLILNHLISKRDGHNCVEFLKDLQSRVVGRFQLSTDGYRGYVGGDYYGGVRSVFGDEIDYGSEVKQFGPAIARSDSKHRVLRKFNPQVCKWVKRTPHIGSPNPDQINTSHAERLNLSVRTFNRRFGRLTINYSKTLENHKAASALFVAFYNFVRVHSSIKQTPAMAAGLTNHVWDVAELMASL